MRRINIKYFSVLRYTGDNTPSGEEKITGNDGFTVEESTKQVDFSGLRTKAVVSVREAQSEKSAVRLIFEEAEWDADNYIFAPAALYNGNRFTSLPKEYAPMLTEEDAQQFAGETVITDVSRLRQGESGCAQLNVGDLSFPCLGYYCKKKKTGFLLFFEQKTSSAISALRRGKRQNRNRN